MPDQTPDRLDRGDVITMRDLREDMRALTDNVTKTFTSIETEMVLLRERTERGSDAALENKGRLGAAEGQIAETRLKVGTLEALPRGIVLSDAEAVKLRRVLEWWDLHSALWRALPIILVTAFISISGAVAGAVIVHALYH